VARKNHIYLMTALAVMFCLPCYGQAAMDTVVADTPEPVVTEAVDDPLLNTELKPGYVTVNFKGADIKAVLNYLSDVGGVDIVPAPDVSGPITLKLTNKPWQTALDIIVRNYGFAYEREGDIIRIVTVDSLKMEELKTEVLELNYAKAEDIMESIRDMLTERGKISADERTNYLVITDVPANIYKIQKVLNKLDRKTPQIMIEAKIIETELVDTESMGIDWNIVIGVSGAARPTTLPFDAFQPDWGFESSVMPKYFPVGTTGTQAVTVGSGGATTTADPADFPTGSDVTLDSATYAFPFAGAENFTYGTLDFSAFHAILNYLKKRADTEVISNPRITTLNNREAKIFVGSIYYYISKMETDDDNNEVTYEYKEREIGIRLLVTPKVNEDEEIVVELKPEIKAVVGYQQLTNLFSLPIFSTREAETEVMIGDGDTIFIGGLIKEDVVKEVKKFPVLGDMFGDLPFVGNLVKHEYDSKDKTELIFFITVHIVRDAEQSHRLAVAATKRAEAFVKIGPDIVNNAEPKIEMPEVKAETDSDAQSDSKPLFDFRKKK